MARIQNGETPDGSGDPIPGSVDIPNDVGAVLFVGPGPVLDTDGSAFFYDDTNNRLGLGTSAPLAVLHIAQAGTTGMVADSTKQLGSGANVWGVQLSGSPGGTGHGNTATNDGAASVVVINNVVPNDYDLQLRFDVQTLPASTRYWTVRLIACQSKEFSVGSLVPDGALLTVRLTNHSGTTAYAGPVLNLDTVVVNATGTPYIALDFLIDTQGAASGSLPEADLLELAFDPNPVLGYDITFRITQIQIFAGTSAGNGSDLTQWYTSTGATLTSWVDVDGFANFPRLNLLDATGDKLTIVPSAATTAHTLTMPGAQGAANTFLLNNGSGTLSWSTLGAVGGDFLDSLFRIVDNGDPTKKLAFEVSAITAATTRTVTVPNASGTLPLLESNQVFSGIQTFTRSVGGSGTVVIDGASGVTDGVTYTDSLGNILFTTVDAATSGFPAMAAGFAFYPDGSVGTGNYGTFASAALTAVRTWTFPNVSGTVAFLTAAQTFTQSTLGVSSILISSTASSGVSFTDTTTSTKKLRMVLSGAVGNNSITLTNTAARNYGLGNLSGFIPVVGDDPPAVASGALGKVDLAGQTAAIGSTNLSSTPPAGLYRVEVYAACTTVSGSGAPTLDVNIAWTDVVGATNRNVTAEPGSTAFPLSLAATGRASATLLCQVASGDIAYTTTINAAAGTPQYAIYIRVVALG